MQIMMKHCAYCNKDLPETAFSKSSKYPSGRRYTCKKCEYAQWRKWHSMHKEERTSYMRSYNDAYRQKHYDDLCERKVCENQIKRLRLLQLISGVPEPFCARCGFKDLRALQIDHINGGGKREITRFRDLQQYYSFLNKMELEELRKKYQILCANCNWIKTSENRECWNRKWKT